jgi:Holliday junction resolvasome RuvABC ATP-dependent DNA helicase subunit
MLNSLSDQAEAVEMENLKLKSEAEAHKRRIRELEERVVDPDKVDGLGFKFLRLLFDKGCALSLEDIAPALGITKSHAEHCRDVLVEKKMIEKTGEGRSGFSGPSRFEEWRSDLFGLTPKGRKYAVESSGAN